MAALASGAQVRTQSPVFELRPQEHIAIVGNTLAERFQHDGWLEAIVRALINNRPPSSSLPRRTCDDVAEDPVRLVRDAS